MKIHILTLFPGAFDSFLSHSIVKRAIEKRVVEVSVHNLRDFTHDRHRTCDDRPFGGGPGMLLKPEPIYEAVEKLFPQTPRAARGKKRFIYLTPQGKRFDQKKALELSREKELVILCGHYEGVDERVIEEFVTDEVSIGDYVLTGGEPAAMVVTDAVVRLLKGALGNDASKEFESFSGNLLEYPQYTRPAVFRGRKVPPVLLSGNHRAIESWKKTQAARRTKKRRPDLLKKKEKSRAPRD
ncbi:MAG: tRNA (guanosine(37)-N1)-methyltransferase TrmD [Candidatus Omnitrophica bacterium]|nr:tRNA (guanosine(37)-N1)-methyltransferase TrmD [Candidatus Omnitrophota bacterium]